MSGGRALGYGLLAGAGGIALLLLLWLAVSGARGGGIVLGLLLLFVLAGPLAGGGWYVLSRARVEQTEEAAFVGKRRIVEADRVFRRELGAQLRQLASTPGLPTTRLERMADSLQLASDRGPEWYDTVQLNDTQAALLRRYDDLVWERVRWLRDHADSASTEAIADLQRALDQRTDLLLRGREAPGLAPGELLRAQAPGREAKALADLGLNDAVTVDDADYVVEGLAGYFADGRTWKLAHLAPADASAADHWLYVGPEAVEAALLDEQPATADLGIPQVSVDGTAAPLADSGTAAANVSGQAGQAQGILISYWLYRSGRTLALAERWPDGATHLYAGHLLRPSDLQVWPAARPTVT